MRGSDDEALITALEDAEDAAALFAADAREAALGRVEARADHLSVELVMRLLDGEPPVRIWREHKGLSPEVLAEAAGLSLADALGIAIDDVVGPSKA